MPKLPPGRPPITADTPLSPSRAKFVEIATRTGSLSKAAEGIGADPKRGKEISYEPNVHHALLKVVEKTMEKAQYNSDAAMAEAKAALEFAYATENANAAVKAVELRAKLSKLLEEKNPWATGGGFQIQIVGLGNPEVKVVAPSLEVSPKQIESPKFFGHDHDEKLARVSLAEEMGIVEDVEPELVLPPEIVDPFEGL